MNMKVKTLIDDYKSYLIKKKIDIDEVSKNIKTLENIQYYRNEVKNQLDKLEHLSREYKLYDSNYNEFMIAMGKFSICLDKLDVEDKYKTQLIESFTNIHDRFEELEQSNIMKDVYIWKYLK